MTGPQIVLKLYFGIAVPVLGGFAVAFGGYEFVGLSFFVALAVGVLYGFAAYHIGPHNSPPLTGPEATAVVAWGTVLLGSIPVAAGVAFLVAEKAGSLPSLVVTAVAALATTALAAALLRGGEIGNRPTPADWTLRGSGRGGNADYARQLRDEEERR